MIIRNSTLRSILILVLSALLIVGYGHGIAVIGMIELIVIPSFFKESYIQNTYENDLFLAAFILLIGQLLLIVSLFIKHKLKVKGVFEVIGILTLLIAFFILVYPMDDGLRKIGFYGGLPFLSIAILTLIFHFKTLKNTT
jgi:hypothetical protein